MMISAIRSDIPGALIQQSWGKDNPTGPTVLDMPTNSFWVVSETIDRIAKQGDSWALSGFDGYPKQPLPSRWSYDGIA